MRKGRRVRREKEQQVQVVLRETKREELANTVPDWLKKNLDEKITKERNER